MQYLITPSLYSSWYWYKKINSKTKQDFLNTLNKVKEQPSPAMSAGIEFETAVMSYADGFGASNEPCIIEFGELLQGASWQDVVKRPMTISGLDLLLYGKVDAIKKDTVYDIKVTKNYVVGKYEVSIQHLLYMYCSNIGNFEYLIHDGKANYKEHYNWSFGSSYDLLVSRISNMLSDIIADNDFKEVFDKNWRALNADIIT